jgi:hypothetical protein
MGNNFVKMLIAIVFCSLSINSCQTDTDTFDEKFQIYNDEGIPIKWNSSLVGIPLYPYTIELLSYPEWVFTPGTPAFHPLVYPWTIQGRIVNGKMEINFPNKKLELTSFYENDFTGNVRICIVYIEEKNSNSMKYGLHKIDKNEDSRVYIYYSSDDFDRSQRGITLKAGWNFIEEIENPNWSDDNDEPFSITGLISHDINDFYQKGYRWQLEYWF